MGSIIAQWRNTVRGAADRGEYRQAAGATGAKILNDALRWSEILFAG
jgi:hypothetical protein